jgi:excisionase family DNA binding protein
MAGLVAQANRSWFDAVSPGVSIWGMVVASPDKEWLTVSEAADLAGCTAGWIRLLLGRGELEGWKAGERAWLVKAAAAKALRSDLTSRSVGKRDTKPAAPKRRKSR